MPWDKERYANDPVYRAKIIAINDAWTKANRPKVNAAIQRRRATDPKFVEARRGARLLHKYGITLQQYDVMVQRQNRLCMLCQRRPIERLCVDHCHDAEMVRSLLCRRCNTGLGNFGDDPDLLRDGADYVEIWRMIHAMRRAAAAKSVPKKTSKSQKSRRKERS